MSAMASQTTGVSIVCSTVCSGADQRKHQSSASLAFARGIHRLSVDSHHKGPVTRKMFPFDDVIMNSVWPSYDAHGRDVMSIISRVQNNFDKLIAFMLRDALTGMIHTWKKISIKSNHTSFYMMTFVCQPRTYDDMIFQGIVICIKFKGSYIPNRLSLSLMSSANFGNFIIVVPNPLF